MTFLSILLVASAFYFANARPDTQTWSTDAAQASDDGAGAEAVPTVPEESSVSITDLSEYQEKMTSFMQDVSKAVDDYMAPFMSQLNVTKQVELKTMGMNGIASYVNYLFLLIQDIKKYQIDADGQTQDDSLPRDEMILEFESFYPFDMNAPFFAAIPDGGDEDNGEDEAGDE